MSQPDPIFAELASFPKKDTDPAYRLCLDSVDLPDTPETNRAFVWRGNAKGPNGFRREPAAFSWAMLGDLMREAIATGEVSPSELAEFFAALSGPDR